MNTEETMNLIKQATQTCPLEFNQNVKELKYMEKFRKKWCSNALIPCTEFYKCLSYYDRDPGAIPEDKCYCWKKYFELREDEEGKDPNTNCL